MKKFFLVFTLALVVTSQPPPPVQRRCREAPAEFFGYFREVNYDARPGEVSFRFANISYSRTDMKIKVIEFERREGDTNRFETGMDLYLFNEKIHYEVTEGHCVKHTLTDEDKIPDFGIPEDATFFGADYIGAKVEGLGVLVDQFHHRDENGGDYHGSFVPVSTGGSICWPILENFVRRAPPRAPPTTSSNVEYTMFNLTTSLPLNAFSVPKQCIQTIRGRNIL